MMQKRRINYVKMTQQTATSDQTKQSFLLFGWFLHDFKVIFKVITSDLWYKKTYPCYKSVISWLYFPTLYNLMILLLFSHWICVLSNFFTVDVWLAEIVYALYFGVIISLFVFFCLFCVFFSVLFSFTFNVM